MCVEGAYYVKCVCFNLLGWQWNPMERPLFAEIHQAFETMFHDSSISEGTILHLANVFSRTLIQISLLVFLFQVNVLPTNIKLRFL